MNNTNDDSNPILIFWASINTVWLIFLILKLFGLLPDWTWPVILFPILAECAAIFGIACGILVLSLHSRIDKK